MISSLLTFNFLKDDDLLIPPSIIIRLLPLNSSKHAFVALKEVLFESLIKIYSFFLIISCLKRGKGKDDNSFNTSSLLKPKILHTSKQVQACLLNVALSKI